MMCLALTACKSSEQRAEEAYQRGLELIEAGDEARARVEFRNAVRLTSTHMGAHMALGQLNLRDGSLRPAFRSYRSVAEQDPDNLEANIALAQISFLSQRWEEFDRYGDRAMALAPDNPDVKIVALAKRYRQAALDEDTSTRPVMLAEAETLAEGAPENRVLRRLLIDGYLNESKFEEGLATIDKAIEANPRRREFYDLKIRVLARLGDNSGIEKTLRRLVEVFPKENSDRANLLRYLIARGQIDEAESFLRTEIENADTDEDRANAVIDLVRFLNGRRGADIALAELDTRLAEDPDNGTLKALRATINFDSGNRETAIAELEALLSGEEATDIPTEERQRYSVALASMLSQTGNEVGARRLVEEILEQDPNEVGALKMRAQWLISEDDTNGAISALRTALAASPRDADAMTLMSRAYRRAGNTDLMLNFLSLAVEASGNAPEESLRYANALLADDKVDQAESTLITALRLQPNNPSLLSRLGRVYLQQDDRARARQVIDALKRINDDPAAQTDADAIELELISREQGAEQALDYLTTMSETHSENARIKLALIRGLLESGQTEEALSYVDELVTEDPDNMQFAYFKALTLSALRDFGGAETVLQEMVAEIPQSPLAWLQLARIRAATGGRAAVGQTIDEGLSHMPQSPDLLWAKASFLEQSGDIDGSIGIYEQLYETNSNSLVIANNLASMLATYRNDAESLERARVIARRLKGAETPALQDTYGWILYRSGEIQEAVPYLEAAARALVADPNVQVHLGLAYAALGRTDEAGVQLVRAREVAGPAAGPQILEKIAELEATLAQ